MTRINTNISSLVAQNILGRSNAALEQSLTRLSTGLRINTGKDDPAGLIASENLRSDISAIKRAISNTDRANQVIATADSALGQVSSLLTDIRGLVTEAANTGAMSPEQIAANQSQIDSSLEALNRIAQTTSFQGRRLLDGSLDFITTAGSGFGTVSDLKIDQANLGASGQVAVAVDITASATQAQITSSSIAAAVAGVAATGNFVLSHTATQASGAVAIDTAGPSGFTLTAVAGGPADGAEGNSFTAIDIVDGAVAGTSYDANTGVLTVTVDITGGDNTTADLFAAINAGTDFVASAITGGTETIAATNAGTGTLTGGRDAGSGTITVTAVTAGTAANGVEINLIEDNTIGANSAVAAVVGGDIEVRVNGTVGYAAINSAINNLTDYNSALSATSGDTNYVDSLDTPAGPPVATLAGGSDASGGLDSAIVLEVAGADGADVLSFGAGTDITTIVNALNAVQDATGVVAADNGGILTLSSVKYGSDAFVSVTVSDGDSNGTFAGGLSAPRDTGTDIVASINGIAATGKGNTLSINTVSLDMTMTVDAGSSTDVNFTIAGGGGLFQLGPDVVTNQQARIGITSVNTSRLGGVSGKLYQLGSGGSADLETDPTTAARIVEEAINQITGLRGRLGAFQRTTLETNKNALNDTLVNITEAESQIRDADFAAETAALTRAQILVQSGTTVLSITNQNPQNVLALLR
jgi:flagellin